MEKECEYCNGSGWIFREYWKGTRVHMQVEEICSECEGGIKYSADEELNLIEKIVD
jgi:DnaJ-class molecular chaperone